MSVDSRIIISVRRHSHHDAHVRRLSDLVRRHIPHKSVRRLNFRVRRHRFICPWTNPSQLKQHKFGPWTSLSVDKHANLDLRRP